MLSAHACYRVVGFHGKHRGVALDIDVQFTRPVNVALGIFGTGELLLEAMQAEAVMDALAKNTAGVMLAFKHKQVIYAVLPGGNGSSQTRGAAADDQHVHVQGTVFHHRHVTFPP